MTRQIEPWTVDGWTVAPEVSKYVGRDKEGRLRCELHGSHRCQDVRNVRKAGHDYRTAPADPILADPIDRLPDDPTTWTSDQLHTYNTARRDRIDADDHKEN